MGKERILDVASSIANLPVHADLQTRYRIRALVLQVAKMAIEDQQKDPKTIDAIENWIESAP